MSSTFMPSTVKPKEETVLDRRCKNSWNKKVRLLDTEAFN